MARNLIRLMIDSKNTLRNQLGGQHVTGVAVSEPKIHYFYSGNSKEVMEMLWEDHPPGANACLIGEPHPKHLDYYPVQYYHIKEHHIKEKTKREKK